VEDYFQKMRKNHAKLKIAKRTKKILARRKALAALKCAVDGHEYRQIPGAVGKVCARCGASENDGDKNELS